MRMVARLLGWGLVTMAVGACSEGVPGTSFTFGPVTTGQTPPDGPSTTTMSDPTTGGQGRTDSGRPDDSTGRPSDTTGPGETGPGETATSGTDTGPGDSSDDSGPVCGDGVADPGEDCDMADLGGLTCADVDAMFTGGALACDGGCAFDTSGCSAAVNPIVVCQAVGGAIPDDDPTGLSDTLMLPAEAVGVTITDVNVEVELDHTFIGDLDIDVTSDGTNVLLFSTCGFEDDLHMTFDDAGAAVSCADSDINQSVLPASPLSAFNGGATVADWTLRVEDTANIDTGTLQQWCVTIAWM